MGGPNKEETYAKYKAEKNRNPNYTFADNYGQFAKEREWDNEFADRYKKETYEESGQAFNDKLAKVRAAREEDLAKGRTRGEEIFGKDALGRINAGRSADVSDIISRRKANLNGYSAEEQNALKEGALNNIDQNAQTATRGLATQQAKYGVRGAPAAAQAAKLLTEQSKQKADQERELFIKNIDFKRAGLDSAEKSITGAEATETGKEQFNIGQANKETFGKLSTELGYGSLGAGERAGIMQGILGEKQADAAKNMANGGKK